MLSRPYLETALWFLVLLLMLLALCWVIDPWHLRHENIASGVDNANHEKYELDHEHGSHGHDWDENETLISLEGLISWRATSPLKKIRLSAVTTQGNIIVLESESFDLTDELAHELSYEHWVELTLPESVNTYLVEAQWAKLENNNANEALEIKFVLGQREEQSWFFWSDGTESIKQVLEY